MDRRIETTHTHRSRSKPSSTKNLVGFSAVTESRDRSKATQTRESTETRFEERFGIERPV